MERTEVVAPVDTYPVRLWRRVSWGAVVAGTVVAIMVMMLINLLMMGIGLQAIDPAAGGQPLAGLATGAVIGVIVSNLIALFLGGWVAGRAAGPTRGFDGALHGLLVWGLLTLLSFWVLSSAAGRVIGGVTSAVGQGLGLVAQGAAALAPDAAQAVEDALADQGVDLDSIRQEATQAAGDIAQNPQTAGRRLDQLIDQVFGVNPSETVSSDDVVDALVANGMDRAQAEQTVASWEETAQAARERIEAAQQDLEEAAQTAADVVGSAALWAFVGLVLGAIVAMMGSAAGRPRTTVEVREA